MKLRIAMAKIRTIQKCRLCLQEKLLCDSHIIPEFCFQSLYDENHRFIEIHDVKRGRVHRGQKGFYEPLLCSSCETHVARFERHSRRLFVDPLPLTESPQLPILVPNLEYHHFKLFLLSILWRSAISSLHVFRYIKLGRHEEELRLRILESDPGSKETYGCMVFPLLFDGKHFRDFMVEPTPSRMTGGHHFYRFVFFGFVFFMIVSSHRIEDRFMRLLVNDTGQIRIFPSEFREFPFLRDVWNLAGNTTRHVIL